MEVEVVLPLPVDRSYTYLVPAALEDRVAVGCCVVVPFRSRTLTGVVVDVPDRGARAVPLKAVLDIADDQPAVSNAMLRLTRWIADYYVCSWGEAVRATLPPGGVHQAGAGVKLERHLRLAPDYAEAGALQTLLTGLRGPKQRALVEALAALRDEGVLEPRQADVLSRAACGAATLARLIEEGVVARLEKEVMRSSFDGLGALMTPRRIELHAAQQRCLSEIDASMERRRFRAFLLHGITGSGKTEVYIEALKGTLRAGRTGIILVPEIALTPQTVSRFRSHFGDDIAVLHSRMGRGERYDAWRKLREGAFRIAIGPRSAILAPTPDLGLIVVDEEHETSYKQFDPAPRYHARDVAVMRASLEDAVCILGSATPSLESYANAESGKYRLLEMPDRVPDGGGEAVALPRVHVVDLALEKKKHRLDGAFSQTLLDAVRVRLQRNEQVILLQNRRGFATIVECQACGWVPECPDCSVTFTYHSPRNQLKCHYCSRARRMPAQCPSCGASELSRHGVGTQRVEQELLSHFADVRVIRMDLDTTSRKHAHHRLLDRFRRGEADVLLGTQMVAKGLDFPRVTLVGIINADTGLLMPDFRAEERTFQLLTQVAGRAGRANVPGEVILQTRNPDHDVIRCASMQDYQSFRKVVLPQRRAFNWPPFSRVVVVEFRGSEEAAAMELARNWTVAFRRHVPGATTFDPAPALVSRVKRQHRFRTVIRASRKLGGEIQSGLRAATTEVGAVRRGARIAIDVDAVDTT